MELALVHDVVAEPVRLHHTSADDRDHGERLRHRFSVQLNHVRGVDVAVEVPVVVLIHGGFLLLRIEETCKGINQSIERRKKRRHAHTHTAASIYKEKKSIKLVVCVLEYVCGWAPGVHALVF